MCGRYALVLRPSQVRDLLRGEDIPVDQTPNDEGEGSPRQSYNFAPGYHGVVCRAVRRQDEPHLRVNDDTVNSTHSTPSTMSKVDQSVYYELKSMKWGLVPFWTKRNPNYGQIMRTINCRDDSLSQPGGMWASMKAKKRCIVIAQGFYEWLKMGPKDKLPHYIRRRDEKLFCFAGLWDSVLFEGNEERLYTYTIITTDASQQMKFIHDRMPVVLDPGSEEMRTWLDPKRTEWSKDLQSLLKPFRGELDIYPVTKEVGKVGNDSASFIVPLDSKENKNNIVNLFANAKGRDVTAGQHKKTESMNKQAPSHEGLHVKRKISAESGIGDLHVKDARGTANKRRMISATRNEGTSPKKRAKATGTPKITQFFGSST